MNDTNHLALRLTPLPKKWEWRGEGRINPSDLTICSPDDDVWSKRAARELSLFIRDGTGIAPRIVNRLPEAGCSKPCVVLLSEGLRAAFAPEFQEPFFDDFNLNPGFQAYRMKCLIGDHRHGGTGNRILIQGLAAEGVYWGMKTLKQLMTAPGQPLNLPRIFIVDGADLEERGLWTNTLDRNFSPYPGSARTEEHFRGWIDWMSDHKLNLIETLVVTDAGVAFRSRKHPSLSIKDASVSERLLQRLIRHGEERGVRMIPTVVHTDYLGFMSRHFPQLKAVQATPHHGRSLALPINYFNEKAAAILQNLVEEVAAAFQPRGICLWLTENRLHPLGDAGPQRSYFLREVEVFSRAIRNARNTVGRDLELRILLSQGSYPENSRLIRSLPKEVKWIYYSGERRGTYTVRPINPIPAEIALAAKEGYWISLCPVMGGIKARSAVLEVLHQNIGYAIQAGLKAIDGMSYAFPADRPALFVAAQHAWNYHGRSLDETFLAYAAEMRAKDPAAHARAYRLMDQANGVQARRDSVGVGHPLGNHSRFHNMLERIKTNDKVDELIMIMADAMEVDDLPALSQAVTDLETALGLLDAKADPLGYLRCRYLLSLTRICLAINCAFYMNCREKSWDLYKGPWGDFRAETRRLMMSIQAAARESTAVFEKLVKLEKWGGGGKPENPLVRLAASAKTIVPSAILSSREMHPNETT